MKKLGFGLMRLPLLPGGKSEDVDLALAQKMFDEFIAAGFTYFDTAYFYHNNKSEGVFGQLVAQRYPRSAYTITDKLPIALKPKAEDLQSMFDGQLERCGVDYFDIYLLHCLTVEYTAYAEEIGAWEFLSRVKAEGKARQIGFSFHDTPECLDDILTRHPEVDYVQLQINYLDWENPKVQSRACYEVARKHGKAVIIMEPVKGGSLAGLPGEAEAELKAMDAEASIASWAVRFAASLEGVYMVLSGMSTPEQVADNCAFMASLTPLTDAEHQKLLDLGEKVRKDVAVPCTSCKYCVEGCPQQIPIPSLFSIYNNYKRFHTQTAQWRKAYADKVKEGGAASSCIGCRQCEEHCPQHLDITALLARVAGEME